MGVCTCPPIGFYDPLLSGTMTTFECVPCPAVECETCLSNSSYCDTCYGLLRDPLQNCTCKIGYYSDF